jgi:hypothetical protein
MLPQGACTALFWEVQNATAVYLDGMEVDSQASQEACPEQTQGYTLRVVYPGGERTAQLVLEVVDAIAVVSDAPSIAAATATVEVTASPTPRPVGATSISQRAAPALETQPIKRNAAARPAPNEQDTWSIWTRLGLWGGLVGGWCLIAIVALIGWGGFWWFNSHRLGK